MAARKKELILHPVSMNCDLHLNSIRFCESDQRIRNIKSQRLFYMYIVAYLCGKEVFVSALMGPVRYFKIKYYYY